MSSNEKIALVTGASRGIGQAIAIALAKRGFKLAGTATTVEGAEKITRYLQEQGYQGSGYMLDVCNPDSIQELLEAIKQDYGVAPAVLVNNAAITQDNILLRMKPEQWDAVINTNLSAIYRVTKACLKTMLKARWGRIINITSVVGVTGNPGQANYSAAKAGVIGFSKSLAQEVAAYGITINAVAPGFIDTDMTRQLNDKQRELITSKIPMQRIGAPEDIGNAVVFLAADEAVYITGQTLHVNGGMFMA